MANLHRHVHALDHPAAVGHAVVNGREAVEHGAIQPDGFLDAVFRFFIAVLAGVAVDGRGQKIGFAELLQMLKKLDVLFHHRHAGARLYQRFVVLLGFYQLAGENAVLRHRLVIRDGFLQIHVPAGGPLGEHLGAQRLKLALRNLPILYSHRCPAPFS